MYNRSEVDYESCSYYGRIPRNRECHCKKFSENGYRVFNLSRTPAEGIESIKTDVSDRENVFASIGEVVKRAGRIDVLVNNAGFGISGAVEDTDESAVRKILTSITSARCSLRRRLSPLCAKTAAAR